MHETFEMETCIMRARVTPLRAIGLARYVSLQHM